MTTLAHSLPRPREGTATALYDVGLMIAGSLVIAGLAQLYVKLPFTPVPVTGQTLAVLLVGASLGPWRGAGAAVLYLAWGAIGLPFFAEGRSGAELLALSSATGGYLWGFVVAAGVVGKLAERGWDRKPSSAIGAMFVGELIIFTFGVVWLAQAIDVPIVGAVDAYDDALDFGLYPFVVGDVLKVLIAAAALPGAWKLVHRRRNS